MSCQTSNKLLKKIPYEDRLMHLELPALKYRRLRGS